MKPKAIDLFAGCGGLTLGLKHAGFDVIGAVEIDSLAVETYNVNNLGIRLWHQDIRKLTAPKILNALSLKPGDLDLLAGCPPCQGFSAMRRLNGGRRVRDKRNDLIFDFLRLVKGLRPKAIMMENVPGLANNARLPKLKLSLKRLGYKVNAAIKDAQHYGVPQRRRRFILLAGYNSEIPFGKIARHTYTVRKAFSKLSKRQKKRDPLHNFTELRSVKVRRIIRLIPKNGGSRLDLGVNNQLACHRKCDGFRDVYGRMSWEKVAPTITSGCVNPSSVSNTSKAQPDFVRHSTNRRLATEAVLNYLQMRLPRQYEIAEVVGKWVWLDVSPARKPNLANLLWSLGFHWNQRRAVWQHPCGSFDPLGSHPTDPRNKYRCYFPADVLPA